jgi:hypothetical protein
MAEQSKPPLEYEWEYDEETGIIECQGVPLARVYGVEDFPCLDPESDDIPAHAAEIVEIGRTMAASPLLFAACEKALDLLGAGEVNDSNRDNPSTLATLGVVLELTSAIAKARGGR